MAFRITLEEYIKNNFPTFEDRNQLSPDYAEVAFDIHFVCQSDEMAYIHRLIEKYALSKATQRTSEYKVALKIRDQLLHDLKDDKKEDKTLTTVESAAQIRSLFIWQIAQHLIKENKRVVAKKLLKKGIQIFENVSPRSQLVLQALIDFQHSCAACHFFDRESHDGLACLLAVLALQVQLPNKTPINSRDQARLSLRVAQAYFEMGEFSEMSEMLDMAKAELTKIHAIDTLRQEISQMYHDFFQLFVKMNMRLNQYGKVAGVGSHYLRIVQSQAHASPSAERACALIQMDLGIAYFHLANYSEAKSYLNNAWKYFRTQPSDDAAKYLISIQDYLQLIDRAKFNINKKRKRSEMLGQKLIQQHGLFSTEDDPSTGEKERKERDRGEPASETDLVDDSIYFRPAKKSRED